LWLIPEYMHKKFACGQCKAENPRTNVIKGRYRKSSSTSYNSAINAQNFFPTLKFIREFGKLLIKGTHPILEKIYDKWASGVGF
jgi:hypothetical protein